MNHDFDFLHGRWKIDHRVLKARLADATEWRQFTTHMTCRPILGGAGNIDENEFPEHGYHAIALRLYDEPEQTWSIYWITSRSAEVGSPVIGRFDGTVGEFTGEDMLDGRPVLCRYRWFNDTPQRCRWEQALSADNGSTWETNWYMDFARQV